MAFPAVVGRNVTSLNTAATSHDIDIGSPASGTLVVILARVTVGTTGITWPAGWTELVASDTTDASDDATAIAYRLCDGTEGATVTVTCTSSKLAALAYEITGAANPATQAPELSTIAVGASTTPDPTTCTPTGGAKDYLWLWLGAWEGEQTSPPTGNPTNYTDPQGANTGIAGSVTANCRVAIAERNLNASSEDPGSWTISASDQWSAWTMAIHPAGSSPQSISVVAASETETAVGVPVVATITVAVGAAAEVETASAVTIPAATFSLVQEKTGGATSTTLTVTLDATPTVGNTLIARVASRDSTRLGHIAGFKPLDWNIGGNGSASVWYRQVQTGDSAAVVLTNNASAVCTMHVEEVVGQLVPHRSANRFDGNTDVTTFGTGVTPATTATGLACAFVAHRNITSTGYSWADSYTLRATQTQGSGVTGVTGIPGDKIVTTGTQEGVLSWTTAARPWSCIGVLVEDAEPALDAYATEVLSHSPFSYYRLDDPGAVGAADLVGNVHLKYSGGYSQHQTGVITGNAAVSFDGVDGMATEDPIAGWASYTGDCTVILWVKTPDPNQAFGSAAFLSRQNDAHGTHAFMLDGTGDWNFHYRDTAVVGQNLNLGPAATDTWEFFAWTIGAAGVKVYASVAGIITQVASATDITQGNFDLHQLAKTQGAVWLDATIDEVAVWHSVLTSTVLQDIYDASGVIPTQSISVGATSETETAGTVGVVAGVVTIGVGVANETETAQAVAVVIGAVSIAVGVATETESANTVGAAFLVPVGVATETESAGVVTAVPGTVTVTVGVASETETANAVAAEVAQLISVGVATEIETAKTVTPAAGGVSISVGTATETETAYTVDPVAQGGPQTISVAVAIEVETAGAVTIDTTVTIAVGAVSETETAVGVIATPGAVLVSVGVASETETAGTVTPTSGSGITAVFTGEAGSETLRNTTRGIKRNSTRGIKRNTTRRITSKRD